MYNDCQVQTLSDGAVLTLNCIFPLITNLILWAIGLAGTIALVMIILSGYKFLFSGGEAKAVDGARKTLTFAIAGLFLIFLSFLILNIIATFTGVGCLDFSHGIPTSFTSCQ
jgi:hypothetical protein